MVEDFYFLDEGQVKITAASVGISRQRWTVVKEDEICESKQIELMRENRFDHLPIEPKEGTITEYFKTTVPNSFENIEKQTIIYEDIIPLDTNIRDVIDKFVANERSFYFLSFNRSISGLITLGNLNCKQVQIYIFSKICELERELGNYLNSCLTSEEIKNWIEEKSNTNDPKDKYRLILINFNELKNSDLDNQLTEHLFLVDFFKIISNKELFKKLGFSKTKWNEVNSINELRKRIAHPTRSLLDKNNNINKLKERLDKIDDLTFRLVTYRKNSSR
jgi:hypothetical protein